MAIIGLGTDIADVGRIEKVLSRTGESFARRILTDEEFQCFAQDNRPERFLAKRFAVKEAASKALGTGIALGVSFQDFTVTHDERGKPLLALSGKAHHLALSMGVNAIHLSISDEHHYAVATVILES